MLKEFFKFYNLTMLLASIIACIGGLQNNESMTSVALAMIAASGTSYQAQYKDKDKSSNTTTLQEPL